MSPLLGLALTAACSAGGPADPSNPPDAAEQVTAQPDGPRIVAVGDVHGDLDATRRVLKKAGLAEGDTWTGGDAVLVQVGDVLDRGDDEPDILALLAGLRSQARAQGGDVVQLLGNHELMNVLGDLRYVTPDGAADYASTPTDGLPDAALDRTPPPLRGRLAAFAPGSAQARAFAGFELVHEVDGTWFVHGGLLPEHVAGLDALETATRAFLRGEGPLPDGLMTPESPLWTRAWSQGAPDCARLTATLEALGGERLVVAHTPQPAGVNSACDGKVWRVDVGLARHYGGPSQALEIVGDRLTPIR